MFGITGVTSGRQACGIPSLLRYHFLLIQSSLQNALAPSLFLLLFWIGAAMIMTIVLMLGRRTSCFFLLCWLFRHLRSYDSKIVLVVMKWARSHSLRALIDNKIVVKA